MSNSTRQVVFTEALSLVRAARVKGFQLMVGCMVGTSLAMAPACFLTQDAEFVDLDAPLLLAKDRQPGLRYDGSTVYPPRPALWARLCPCDKVCSATGLLFGKKTLLFWSDSKQPAVICAGISIVWACGCAINTTSHSDLCKVQFGLDSGSGTNILCSAARTCPAVRLLRRFLPNLGRGQPRPNFFAQPFVLWCSTQSLGSTVAGSRSEVFASSA